MMTPRFDKTYSCRNWKKTMSPENQIQDRYELIRDYQEKCAAMEEDMLGWKDRALAAETKLAEAVAALEKIAASETLDAKNRLAGAALLWLWHRENPAP